MSIGQYLAAAFTGVAAEKVVTAGIDGSLKKLPHIEDEWEHFVGTFPDKFDQLCSDMSTLARIAGGQARYDTVYLEANGGYQLSRRGTLHVSVLAMTTFPVLVRVSGLGFYTPTLPVSWAALDYPDGTQIELPQGVAGMQQVLFYYSDVSLGNAI
jgi:hypothetical protein